MKNLKLPNALKLWASALLLLCCFSSIGWGQTTTIKFQPADKSISIKLKTTGNKPTSSTGVITGPDADGLYTLSSNSCPSTLTITGDLTFLDVSTAWRPLNVDVSQCENLSELKIGFRLLFSSIQLPKACKITGSTLGFLYNDFVGYNSPFGKHSSYPVEELAAQFKAGVVAKLSAGTNILSENTDYSINRTTGLLTILSSAFPKILTNPVLIELTHPLYVGFVVKQYINMPPMESFTLTPDPKKTYVSLKVVSPGGFFVNWGDGIIVNYPSYSQISGVVKGSKLTVFGITILEIRAEEQCFIATDISKCPNLTRFESSVAQEFRKDPRYTGLTRLDISKNLKLETLIVNDNSLSALDFSNNTKISYLTSSQNKLDFNTIKGFDSYGIYIGFQKDIVIPEEVPTGTIVDLSQYGATRFEWTRIPQQSGLEPLEGVHYITMSPGVFRLIQPDFERMQMRCTLYNDGHFSGINLSTTPIIVNGIYRLKSSQETDLTTVAENEVATATVAVLPNPAQNSIIVSGLDGASLQIVSYTGTVVRDIAVYDGRSIDISSLAAGLYTVVSGGTEVRFAKE